MQVRVGKSAPSKVLAEDERMEVVKSRSLARFNIVKPVSLQTNCHPNSPKKDAQRFVWNALQTCQTKKAITSTARMDAFIERLESAVQEYKNGAGRKDKAEKAK